MGWVGWWRLLDQLMSRSRHIRRRGTILILLQWPVRFGLARTWMNFWIPLREQTIYRICDICNALQSKPINWAWQVSHNLSCIKVTHAPSSHHGPVRSGMRTSRVVRVGWHGASSRLQARYIRIRRNWTGSTGVKCGWWRNSQYWWKWGGARLENWDNSFCKCAPELYRIKSDSSWWKEYLPEKSLLWLVLEISLLNRPKSDSYPESARLGLRLIFRSYIKQTCWLSPRTSSKVLTA